MTSSCFAAALGAVALLLSGCAAPRLTNPSTPGADLQMATAACRNDAERVARLETMVYPNGAGAACNGGPLCAGLAETRKIQMETQAFAAHKRCMAAKGWREAG
jgi:hypothetical protein